MNSILLIDEQPLNSRLLAELALHPGGTEAWEELCKSVPHPLDLRLVASVIRGARQSLHTAYSFLAVPNAKANALAQQLDLIESAIQCTQDTAHESDAPNGLIRTLSSYPEWRLLSEAGIPNTDGTAFQFVVGVELSVSIAEGRPMAHAFSVAVRRDKANLTVLPDLLLESLFDPDAPLTAAWSTRLKKQLTEFTTLFEGGQPRPIPTKTLNERFESQWSTKAAFAPHAARAAILDSRCLSLHQFERAIRHPRGERDDEYRAAMFFVGFCGFSPSLVAEIPLQHDLLNTPACHLNFCGTDCHLVRDFGRLAYDQASPEGVDGQPASLVLSTPLPRDINLYLCGRMRDVSHARNLGDLVPLLTQIQSSDALYPSLEELDPSWAKLRPTVGRTLRQHGFDSFLTALLTADFANSAKSKIYYATVTPQEWWKFVVEAYEVLGFEAPLPLETQGLAFGSRVTPTSEQIRKTNLALTEDVERARPNTKAGLQALLDFHAAYTRIVAFQALVLLALRESASIALPGCHDTLVLYVDEKSSAGRRGGMAALIPTPFERQVVLYKSHCKALLTRIHVMAPNGFTKWLHKVVQGDSDLDFCTSSVRGLPKPIATGQVLSAVADHTRFAPDLGRKYLENELRLRKVHTEDIDRVLRHDVAGQGAMTGTSDGSEAAWVRRIRPTLDSIAEDLGFRPIPGLGGGSK